MEQKDFRQRRNEIEERTASYADRSVDCLVHAILLLAEVTNEQCEETKLTRLAVEKETQRYEQR